MSRTHHQDQERERERERETDRESARAPTASRKSLILQGTYIFGDVVYFGKRKGRTRRRGEGKEGERGGEWEGEISAQ